MEWIKLNIVTLDTVLEQSLHPPDVILQGFVRAIRILSQNSYPDNHRHVWV